MSDTTAAFVTIQALNTANDMLLSNAASSSSSSSRPAAAKSSTSAEKTNKPPSKSTGGAPDQRREMKDEEAAAAVVEISLDGHRSSGSTVGGSRGANGGDEITRIGWKRLSIVLLVEAVALGCLGIPKSFATLGLLAGLFCTIGIGLICIYTSWIVGQVKLLYPDVHHYADAGRLLGGPIMYEIVSAMFCLQLTFTVGSHCLTGTIAFSHLDETDMCELVFGAITAVALFVVALPPSIAGMAWLGYVDFASIIIAVLFTMVTNGVEGAKQPGGLSASDWSWWPQEGLTFASAFVALGNILFAYSFAIAQFTFMDEMHTVEDFPKSIWALGITQIVVYTCTGLIIYIFTGSRVTSPALLSENDTYTKVAFILAIPVIFISGSINTTVIGKYLLERFARTPEVRHVRGWGPFFFWSGIMAGLTLVAWLIAESIPFFDDLLAISSSLFTSGFSFYFPAWMWWKLLRDRSESLTSKKNLMHVVACVFCSVVGVVIFFAGTYASISDILHRYDTGLVRTAFTCGNT